MGVRYLEGTYDGTQNGATALIDSVSGFAFGPMFYSYDEAVAFVEWLPADARVFSDTQLASKLMRFNEEQNAAGASGVEVEATTSAES